ncbi:hypothetical protein [Schaalia sp. Marseille-Q2122]|uniref:hypothetical protein n=1 Tax=Schaalia sp. Marseille-Q2122 TaxID=2736604 RepID=UPI00158F3D52|nr:hypothetical protein [Schaalia sp. Marseille-Q2122]
MTRGMNALPAPEDRRPQLYRIAGELQRISYIINGTQISVDTARTRRPEWVGEAAEAYVSQLQTLGSKVRDLAPRLGKAAESINEWGDLLGSTINVSLPALWDDWDEANRICEQAIADINIDEMNAQNSPTSPPASHFGAQRERAYTLRDEELVRIRQSYESKIRFLDEAAGDVARLLRTLQDQIVPAKAAAESREAIGAALFDDIPLIDGQAQWEHALSLADDISQGIRDKDLTTEELLAFHEKYGELLKDPFYSRAVLDQVSAEDLYQFAMRIAPGMPGSMIPHEKERSDLLASVGTMLALATGGANYSGDTSLSQESFDQVKAGLIGKSGRSYDEMLAHELQEIHESGRKLISPQGSDYFDAHTDIEGYNLFSQLTGHAANRNPNLTLGAAFYSGHEGTDGQHTPSLAEDILLWDRESGAGLSAARNEGRAPYDLLLGTNSALLDPMQSIFLLSDTPDSLEGLPEDSPQRIQERDRLNAIGDFLSKEAPFTVKVIEGNQSTDKTVSFARYLAGHRNQSFEGSFGFMDRGHAFGNMIADVTAPETHPHLKEPLRGDFDNPKDFEEAKAAWQRSRHTGKVSATVALNFIEGYQDGLNRDHGDDDKYLGQDIYGYSNAELRPWMGKVLAFRAEDLAIGMSESTNEEDSHISARTDGNPYRIKVGSLLASSISRHNGVIADLAFDEARATLFNDPQYRVSHPNGHPPALDYLRKAAILGLNQDLHSTINSAGSGTDNALSRWGKILGYTHLEPIHAAKELREVYAERNERLAQAGEFALDLVTLKRGDNIPGIDEMKESVAGQFADAIQPPQPGVSLTDQRKETAYDFSRDIDLLYRRALTTIEEIPPYHGETFTEVPREIAGVTTVFKPYDQMSDSEKDIFDTYLSNNPGFASHLQAIDALRERVETGWKNAHDTD